VGDEVREKVGEYSEQGQTANAVTGKNPRSAAFVMFGSGRRLLGRRDDRGPIFHAKTSNGKIVAQVRYASRPPRDMGRQDYLDVILPPIYACGREKNVTLGLEICMQIACQKAENPGTSPLTLNILTTWDNDLGFLSPYEASFFAYPSFVGNACCHR
jgi:hypothetical protein